MLAPPANKGGCATAFGASAGRGGVCVWAITAEVPIKLHTKRTAAAPNSFLGWLMAIFVSLLIIIPMLPTATRHWWAASCLTNVPRMTVIDGSFGGATTLTAVFTGTALWRASL